jgi:hypothetical protein
VVVVASTTSRKKKAFSVAALILVAVPTTAHAVHSQREQSRAQRDLEAMTNALGSLSGSSGGDDAVAGVRDVSINGARIYFKQSTENRPLDDVMKGIAKECASGDHDAALGISGSLHENETKTIKLERVVQQDADSGVVKASLCVFEAEENVGGDLGTSREPLRRARYTLAHQREDGTVGVTTIATASSTPLAELFPAEGDSPGSDLAEVARPEASRRTLTAMVGTKAKNAVRVYESDLPTEQAITSYDKAMETRGFATNAKIAEGRMYLKDDKRFVVTFRGTSAGSTVTISQFSP